MGILEEIATKDDSQTASIVELQHEVAMLRERVAPALEVYTLRDLAALPGSPSLKTLRNNSERQPRHGQPDGFRGREKAWRRSTVEEWRKKLSRSPVKSKALMDTMTVPALPAGDGSGSK